MITPLVRRAHIHAVLGEPHRLAIVDELVGCDRTPTQLGRRLGLASNLLSHHLDALEESGLIERVASSGDRRRRYVRLRAEPLAHLLPRPVTAPLSVLFVCTHNSARSPLAAALWTDRTGGQANSAGTHPADRVHPKAVEAASRVGLSLGSASPTMLADSVAAAADVVITVCDQANEELASPTGWWHWSTPDPVAAGTDDAFDATIADLERRIDSLR